MTKTKSKSRVKTSRARGGGEYKRLMKMKPAERDREVAQYEQEDLSEGKPLDAIDRDLIRRAGAKVGRPKIGQGSKMVPITLERGLLAKVDAFARTHGMKRSQLVAAGLRMVIGDRVAG